jgi:hypothetical protein
MAYLTTRPIRFFLAALAICILAQAYCGSPYHQGLLTVFAFALVADGLWTLGRMIADGQTWLPAIYRG